MAEIYTGGPILTMEGTAAEAVLVEGGVIRRVGTLAEVETPGAKRVDLAGATLMPAFLDAHSHVTALASTMRAADLSRATSFDELAAALQDFVERARPAPGEWVAGFGYDHTSLAEGKHPAREVLDRAVPDHPVVVTHASGHMGVLNSLAMRELGGEGGGYLEEAAFMERTAKIPQPTAQQRMELLVRAQEEYLRHGITTIQDGYTRESEYELLTAAARAGKLRTDVVCYLGLRECHGLPKWEGYRDRLRVGGYKIFLDGSPQARTAWMTQPYEDAPDGYRGTAAWRDEDVEGWMETALQEGRQLLAHCNGDAAAEQMLASYAKARARLPGAPDIRPVMIHAQLLRRDQLSELRRLGVIASFFVAHTYYWGDVHLRNLGRARADFISPAATALREGVTVTFHQDTPVILPDMLETVQCAATRVTRAGVALAPSERVTVEQALRAVTVSAAYQYGEEAHKGSIRPGKRADFVVLGRNPLACPPGEVGSIEVLRTIRDGETVFER